MTTDNAQPTLLETPAPAPVIIDRTTVEVAFIDAPRAEEFTPPSKDLVDHIRENGVIEPLILRPIKAGNKEAAKFAIIGGRRRFAAVAQIRQQAARDTDAETLGRFSHVPAVIVNADDLRAASMSALIHSLRSENLLADVESILTLLRLGATETDIREHAGWSRQSFLRRMALVRLRQSNPEIFDLIKFGKLTISAAEQIAKLTADQRGHLYSEFTKSGKPKLTEKDIREAKAVIVSAATKALPRDLFAPVAPTPETVMAQMPTAPETAATGAQTAQDSPQAPAPNRAPAQPSTPAESPDPEETVETIMEAIGTWRMDAETIAGRLATDGNDILAETEFVSIAVVRHHLRKILLRQE